MAPESYLAVRHRGGARSRGHTWIRHQSGRDLDQDIREKKLHPGGPEALLPDWALTFYRDFRGEMSGGISPAGPADPVSAGEPPGSG